MQTTTVKFISASIIADAVAEEICKQDKNADHLAVNDEIINWLSECSQYTFGTNYASLVELVPFVEYCFYIGQDNDTISNPAAAVRAFWERPDVKKCLGSKKTPVFVDLET